MLALARKELRDCQQITFVMLNKFCPLSRKNPTPVLNRQYIKMDRIPKRNQRKPKPSKKYMPFLHYISSFEGTSYIKICKIHQPDILFLVVFISFYINRYHFS